MKKITLILMVLILTLSLCACGDKDPTTEPEQTGPETTQTPEPTQAPDENQQAAVTPAGEELIALLEELQNSCFPGTSGSSLTSTTCAGKLLDYYTRTDAQTEELENAAQAFAYDLDTEAAALYPEQLDLVYSAAQDLCTGDAEELLGSCGYEAESYPWTPDSAADLFSAIYAGLGIEMPA